MSQSKANGNSDSKDILISYLTATNMEGSVEDLDGDNAAYVAIDAFSSLFNQVEILHQHFQKQLQSQMSSSGRGQKVAAPSFDQIKNTTDRIVKIQAFFRRLLTMRRLEKQMKSSRQNFAKKNQELPEEAALREFSLQLSTKRLSPEAFFRICDTDYKQRIPIANFKDQLNKIGIKLSRGQLSRLIMILDEDMEGTITLEEYYDALEAYGVAGEKHKSSDGSVYHPFEHRALFKLVSELRKNNISNLEMFNACDVNDDSRIMISELSKFVEGLSPDFKQKELHALLGYLDLDKNGIVDKDELLRQLTKAEQIHRQSQIINKNAAQRRTMNLASAQENNLFDEVNVGGGDQSIFGFVDNMFSKKAPEPVNKQVPLQDKPPAKSGQVVGQQVQQQPQLDADTLKRKVIIEKMEKEGQNFTSFFSSVKQLSQGGTIGLGAILKALEVSYPTIPSTDRNFLIQSSMAQKGKVDYLQLEELFSRFSKNLKPSVSQTFSVIAGNITKRMGGLTPLDSMRQFFRASNVNENGQIGELEFTELFSGKIAGVTQFDLDQAFRSLDIELDGFISVKDLMDVLISYATGGSDKLSVSTKELVTLIPGFESMSPRTRCEEVIQFIISELGKKNLKPISVFRMADIKNTGGVSLSLLEMTFKKVLPQLGDEVIKESLKGFNAKTARDIVTREDFEIVFREQTKQFIPNSSKTNFNTINNSTQPKPTQSPAPSQSDDEAMKCIRKLDNAMLRERISPGVAFKHADLNCNGVVSVDELKESFKKLIPGESLSLMDINKVMLAFDKNGNGFVEENEFISLIEEARNSNVTYMESPQKNQNFYQEAPVKKDLPTKNNINQASSSNQLSDDMSSLIASLEKKVNLREIFTQLPLNEEGCFVSSNVSRTLKSVQTKDGKGLLPTEYLPLIKSLDSQMRGVFHVKDLLKVLEKYSSNSQPTDITLELKYMANFVEFQMKARFTKVFLQNNSNLQPSGRVMEVEVMAELQKVFGVSMQVGRVLYASIQAQKPRGQDVTLDDISKAIDSYRLVKVEFQAEAKPTQSQQVNSQQTLIKFVLGLLNLQPRRRELVNQKVQQIDSIQKSIPFTDFFELFVTEHQLINNVESKALFEYFCSLGKLPKAIETRIFQQQIQSTQDLIYDCQDRAIGQGMLNQGEAFFTNLSKIKMNDQGYVSKAGFKELLVQYGVINQKGTNPLDSLYVQTFKSQLKQEFQITPLLQADEYVESLLRDEIENCKFWTIVELVSRAVQRFEVCTNLILRYFGKLLDLIGSGKDTASIILKIAPQCSSIASGKDLQQLIEILEQEAQKMAPGYNHGAIKAYSQKCLEQFYQQATKGVPLRIKDNTPPLMMAINRNRGHVPAKASEDLSASINDRETTSELGLVQQVEKATRMKLEDSMKDFFYQDLVTNIAFAKLLQEQGMTEKPIISQLYQAIDKKKTGKVFIKDLILYLKAIPGKFNRDQIVKDLASQVDGPIQKYFEDQGMLANEFYPKNDFMDIVQGISNLNQFQTLCLFYELAGDMDEIKGMQLIQCLSQPKGQAANQMQQMDKSLDGTKKAVSFGQDTSFQRDQKEVEALCKQFVTSFKQINTLTLIKSALTKFSESIKTFKTLADAVSRIEPTGSGIISVDQLKKKLDEIKGLSNEEKLILCFIPVGQNKNDAVEINLQSYLKVIKVLAVDDNTVNQNSKILNQNLEIIKVFLGLSQPQKVEEQKSNVLRSTTTMNNRKDKIEEMKKNKIVKMQAKLAIIIKTLSQAFSVPKNADLVATQFINGKNQNVKYGVLTDFIEENFSIAVNSGPLEQEWEIISQEMDLDRSGKIQFCDFLECCDRLGIKFESKLRSKVIIRQVISDGPATYKIVPTRDYYKGVSTILNSEIAALAMAEKLYNQIKDGEEFLDQDFGPKYEQSVDDEPNADDPDHCNALYCTGVAPRGYIEPSLIKWIRPEAMPIDQGKSPVFIDDGIASNDVKQGKIGNCWFIGALSVIATRDELLRGGNLKKLDPNNEEDFFKIAESFSTGVYPPIFHFYRDKGLYVFRFFKEFRWRYVIIDDRIPCMSNTPVFGSCSQLHEMWVPLIEKAYAKIHGCYEALVSGFIDDALSDMTGLVAEKLQLQDQNKVFPHKSIKSKEEFWNFLYGLSAGEEQSMMGCSAVGDIEGEIVIDGQKCGIMSGHAYGIIDLIELKEYGVINPKTGLDRVHKLMRIRNPWGFGEWNGKWSDNSEEIDLLGELLHTQYINKLPVDERFHPNTNDGTFLMNYQSWRDIYNNMYICVDFAKSWTAIRFDSRWEKTCSGGLPSPMTPENMKRWAINPQYLFKSDDDTELFISLAQPDGRGKQSNGQYMKFPYSDLIHPVNFSVMKLPAGKTKLDSFQKELVVATSVLKEHREISLRVKLDAGSYVIVPCTRNPGDVGDFTLSLYFGANIKDIDVLRIDKPEDEFYLIAEETEQVDNIDEWKLKMIDERLKSTLQMNDTSLNESGLLNQSFQKSAVKSQPAAAVKSKAAKQEYNDDDIY